MNYEVEKITTFKDLRAWKEGHRLVTMVYKLTKNFPREEQYGLSGQLRRAVVSITSNIAEGFSRYSLKEKLQFYTTALGSLTEVQNQLLIAKDVGYLKEEEYAATENQTVVVSKICNGLIKKTRMTLSTRNS
ncbi:MAG TPA: four helix bundle protein [Candidatus Paceibacterota bacterium]